MAQKVALAKGKIQTVSDLLLRSPEEIAKPCKMSTKELEKLVNLVCTELRQEPRALRQVAHIGEEKFTTGDTTIDDVLGGGIQTGIIWEISGENNAGKTQLALQLSLSVQLPHDRGGVSGVACYISTRGDLRTERLQQMIRNHSDLPSEFCQFADVFTLKALNFAAFVRVLSEIVPRFADDRANRPAIKPVKLIVVDTFSDIFDASKDPGYEDFRHRARDLKKASLLLQQLATKYQLAVVILCSTMTYYPRADDGDLHPSQLHYSEQERWFSRADSILGEDTHNGTLGHIWPNQLNARIMMSRTIRTRPRHTVDPKMRDTDPDRERASKRRRIHTEEAPNPTSQPTNDGPVPFRRLSTIFSSVSPPTSCDYVILEEGVIAFPAEEPPSSTFLWAVPILPPPRTPPVSSHPKGDVGMTASAAVASSSHPLSPTTQLEEVVEDMHNHTQDDSNLVVSLTNDSQAIEADAEAEVGPPVEDHAASDSDYYWQDDGDGLYLDL